MKKFYTIKNLCSCYGENIILKNLCLEIPACSLVSLIGPNGSGKTTLLRVLAGLQKYTGSVALHGHEVKTISRKNFARSVSFVMSGRNFHPSYSFSVNEIISMGRMPFINLFSNLTEKDRNIIMRSSELAGVKHMLSRDITSLSDGEKQLVLLACALAQNTDTILLDEPTSSLDPDKSAKVFALLRKLADDGKNIIAAVHDINTCMPYSDYYIALRNGSVIFCGCELNSEVLENLYGTNFISYHNDKNSNIMWRAMP